MLAACCVLSCVTKSLFPVTGIGRNSLNFGALHSADSCHAARIVLLRHTMKRILAMS